MEIIAGLIIGFIITFILFTFTGFSEDSELLDEITEKSNENEELRLAKDNAEYRATDFTRKIKSIKDIIKSDDLYINKIDKIKELFLNSNQDK